MTVLNFSFATLKDPALFDDYVRQAAKLMAQQDVEVVLRGRFAATLKGPAKPPHVAAVFRYRSLEAARAFYESAAYQALVPLRNRACDMDIRFYEE